MTDEDKQELQRHFEEIERRWLDRSIKLLIIFSLVGAVMLFWTAL